MEVPQRTLQRLASLRGFGRKNTSKMGFSMVDEDEDDDLALLGNSQMSDKIDSSPLEPEPVKERAPPQRRSSLSGNLPKKKEGGARATENKADPSSELKRKTPQRGSSSSGHSKKKDTSRTPTTTTSSKEESTTSNEPKKKAPPLRRMSLSGNFKKKDLGSSSHDEGTSSGSEPKRRAPPQRHKSLSGNLAPKPVPKRELRRSVSTDGGERKRAPPLRRMSLSGNFGKKDAIKSDSQSSDVKNKPSLPRRGSLTGGGLQISDQFKGGAMKRINSLRNFGAGLDIMSKHGSTHTKGFTNLGSDNESDNDSSEGSFGDEEFIEVQGEAKDFDPKQQQDISKEDHTEPTAPITADVSDDDSTVVFSDESDEDDEIEEDFDSSSDEESLSGETPLEETSSSKRGCASSHERKLMQYVGADTGLSSRSAHARSAHARPTTGRIDIAKGRPRRDPRKEGEGKVKKRAIPTRTRSAADRRTLRKTPSSSAKDAAPAGGGSSTARRGVQRSKSAVTPRRGVARTTSKSQPK